MAINLAVIGATGNVGRRVVPMLFQYQLVDVDNRELPVNKFDVSATAIPAIIPEQGSCHVASGKTPNQVF